MGWPDADQQPLDLVGDRRLARTRETGEPDRGAAAARAQPTGRRASTPARATPRSGLARWVGLNPGHLASPRIMPAPTVLIRRLVDEDEAARVPVAAVLVEEQRGGRAQRDAADVVEAQLRDRLVSVQRVDVEPIVQFLDDRSGRASGVLDRVAWTPPSGPSARSSSTPWRRCPGSRVGWLCGRQIMSPRDTSMSSASRSETDIGGNASSTGPSEVSIDAIRVVKPRGQHHRPRRRA